MTSHAERKALRPLPSERLNQIASGYSLVVYCKWDSPEHPWGKHDQYADEAKADCWAAARKDGWVIHKDRTATCPKCAKALRL